jgi:hypothetical protein
LPAVTEPLANSGRSFASASIVVARGCSSRSTMTGSPFFCGRETGVISCASRPLPCAAAALAWLASAMASCASRLMP